MFIKKVRKSRKTESANKILELLRKETVVKERQQRIDLAYTAYYDNATEAELKEDSEWAKFAASSLAEVPS